MTIIRIAQVIITMKSILSMLFNYYMLISLQLQIMSNYITGGGVKSFLSKMISQQFSFFKNQAVIDKARLFFAHSYWVSLFLD